MSETKRRTHYRDALAKTRNSLLKLPSVRKLIEMPEDSKVVMRQLCLEPSREANEQALAVLLEKTQSTDGPLPESPEGSRAKRFARLLK